MLPCLEYRRQEDEVLRTPALSSFHGGGTGGPSSEDICVEEVWRADVERILVEKRVVDEGSPRTLVFTQNPVCYLQGGRRSYW